MITAIISRLAILVFGTLYPAYASYKAVRTKDVREYVKWMMYWIVFAFFTCIETFTDIFLAWFPFYYEMKVIIVLWLLSPATRGSSTLYRKFVHPMLTKREQEIDEYLAQAKEKGYTAVLQLGSKGVNYATSVIMKTAIKTFQVQNLRALQGSSSDDELSSNQHRMNRALHFDTTDYTMPKSVSLDAVYASNRAVYYEGSSDDEDVDLRLAENLVLQEIHDEEEGENRKNNHQNDLIVDEPMLVGEIKEGDEDAEFLISKNEEVGAARAREPPKRKTSSKSILKNLKITQRKGLRRQPVRQQEQSTAAGMKMNNDAELVVD